LRNFLLYRIEDETNISGTGIVAEDVEFLNKQCVLRWATQPGSIGIYKDIDSLLAIHGHNGKTVIIWRDYEAAMRAARSTVNNFWEFGLKADFEQQIDGLSNALDTLESLDKKLGDFK
jgi:hypothetical protein